MQVVDSEAEDDSDDELHFLNRRKAARKRQRRVVLKQVQRRVGKGQGTKERPVVLDLEDDEGAGDGEGVLEVRVCPKGGMGARR